MASPTTRWPDSTSIAAAVALSTPPDRATTVGSGARPLMAFRFRHRRPSGKDKMDCRPPPAALSRYDCATAMPAARRTLELQCERFDEHGLAVGRHDNRDIHVPGAVPG